ADHGPSARALEAAKASPAVRKRALRRRLVRALVRVRRAVRRRDITQPPRRHASRLHAGCREFLRLKGAQQRDAGLHSAGSSLPRALFVPTGGVVKLSTLIPTPCRSEANPASRPFPSARLPLIDAPLPETRIPALPTPAEKPFPDAVDDLIDTESAKAAMPKLRLPEAIDEVTCPPSPTAIPVR